ncbi:MAG: 3-dehydroquinate synthase [Candidatus Eisenbacteria bacterium]|nr:3-dehydroquinate synthase [Candidatus Eisenbacteria bacterium]
MSDLVLRYAASRAVSRIRIASGSLDHTGAFVRGTTRARHAAVVSDEHVAALYGSRVLRSMRRAGIQAGLIVVRHGERSKRSATLERLWNALADLGLPRQGAVVALGGGVVGDLAGFAASSWLRGVPWVGVPTTVLAQVDSSVGGKTGIDLGTGKNLVGAFHQPAGVLVDPDVLQTLSARERRAGLAEVVKMGMACDAGLFAWTERHVAALSAGDRRALARAVARSIRVKARVVARDEREREGGGRTALNFGHTLAHAIESARGYRGIRHGEAVAIGMRAAARLSERVAGLDRSALERLDRVLDALGLPRRMRSTPLADVLAAMRSDKKRGRSGPRWVLTPRIGHASVPRLMSGRLVRAVVLDAGARD